MLGFRIKSRVWSCFVSLKGLLLRFAKFAFAIIRLVGHSEVLNEMVNILVVQVVFIVC